MLPSRPEPVRLPRGLVAHATGSLLTLTLLIPATPLRAQGVAELQVTPETMTLAVGQRQPIFAAAYDRQGNLIPNAKIAFWSSDTSVARVQKDGVVVGASPGLAKVEARAQGKRASLAVLITGAAPAPVPPPGRVLTLDPAALSLLPGESALVRAQGLREDGTPAPTGRVLWKSLRPEIASVDSSGLVTALLPGKSVIEARTSDGLMATAPVEVETGDFALSPTKLVLGPGDTDTVRALVPTQANRPVRGGLQWRSTDSSIASVSPAGGIEARAPGTAEIVAAGLGQERRTMVLVHRLAQRLVVTPRPEGNPVELPVGASRQFTAVAQAADSSPIPEVRPTWEIGDTSVIRFDSTSGTVFAKAVGTTTLTTRVRGFEPVIWTIRVVSGTLRLDRSRLGLIAGDRTTVSAVLLDDSGKASGPAPADLQWSTDRPKVASIGPAGTVLGVSPGHALLTVTAPWGKAATADVYVVGDLLVSSSRSGGVGIYQLRLASPDSLYPLLVDGFINLQATYSPDRTRIAFSSNRGGSFDLYLMDADGRNLRRLTTDPGGEGEPTWTPDGVRLVYTAIARGAAPQLFTIRIDGTDRRTLIADTGGNSSADVSLDGRHLVFVSSRDGNTEIYQLTFQSGEQQRLTRSPARKSSPHLLPNGDLLYVEDRGRSKGSRVLRLPPGATGPMIVAETREPIASLDVSANGERIAFVAGRLTDVAKGKAQFALMLQGTVPGGSPAMVPLRPGEQVLSPSF